MNQDWKQPLGVEVLDAKRRVHWAFTRPAARRRDRRQMRARPSEVDLCRCRTANILVRAEERVIDEAYLDLLHHAPVEDA